LSARRRKRPCVFCDYLTFTDPASKRSFRLPLVHIRIRHGGTSFTSIGLVDSEATATFMPADFLGILNLSPKEEGTALGAGGSFSVLKDWIAEIEVLKGRAPFCTVKSLMVAFPLNAGSIPYAVLGRDALFQHYSVTFRENRKHVMFKHPQG